MPRSTRSRRSVPVRDVAPRGERATALVLVPAMTLVLLCLGAIAVDMTLLHAAHRQVHRVAASAAEDAAGMLDERELLSTGRVVVDPERARGVVRAHLDAASLPGELVDLRIATGPDVVEVVVTVEIRHVLLPAVRSGAGTETVTVHTRGRLHP